MLGDNRGSKVEWRVEAGCWTGGGRWEGRSLGTGETCSTTVLLASASKGEHLSMEWWGLMAPTFSLEFFPLLEVSCFSPSH